MSTINTKYHYTKGLAKWVTSLQLKDVPKNIQTRAKHLLLDGVACGLVGAHLPWSAKAASTHFDLSPQGGSATVIGWKKTLPPLDAALLNSSFIQGFELDDWHSEAPLHSNSLVIPTLLAAAEHLKSTTGKTISGKEFLLATMAGYETGPRVGNALWGEHILACGWHSGAVFGPAACASAGGKLLGLNAEQLEDAFGTACTQACGLMSAQFGSDAKRMQHGFAARNGLLGVLLAQNGYSGIKDVFELEYGGFLKQFSAGNGKTPQYKVEELTKELGSSWQTNNICVKPYASMAGTHPTVDCVRALQQQYPSLKGVEAVDNIKAVKIVLGSAALEHGGFDISRPIETTGAQMSNKFVAATQIVHGSVLPGNFRHEDLENDDVWKLVSKIKCEQSANSDDKLGRQTVEIELNNGEIVSKTVDNARGVDPALKNEEIVEKYQDLTGEVIDGQRADKIMDVVLRLDECEDIGVLLELLSNETKNPIG